MDLLNQMFAKMLMHLAPTASNVQLFPFASRFQIRTPATFFRIDSVSDVPPGSLKAAPHPLKR